MSKIERELHGPSLTEVILGAVLSLLLGAALAAVYLVGQPVVTARERPKEAAPGAVYFLEGSRDSGKAREAKAKAQAFLQGSSVELNEDELNALFAPVAAPAAGAKGGPDAPGGKVAASAPNFRVRDGVLQVALPLRVNVLGLDRAVIVQARGGFRKAGDGFVFAPDECYVGACPVQRLPLIEGVLMKRMLAATAVPEEMAAAWRALTDVAVQGSTLKLTR